MKVYAMNDFVEWYTAPTLPEAKAAAAADCEYTVDEAEAEGLFDQAHELSDAELDRLRFIDDDGSTWSFREELERRASAGTLETGFFAANDH